MCDLKGFTAANVGARQLVVASYHVRLCFGEAGAVTLVGSTRELRAFTAHDPCDFVFSGLPALGANESVRALLGGLVEKVAFFQVSPRGRGFPSGLIYSILILDMTKRKPAKFSTTKAVKANARERLGQPKPARVLDTEPRTGREAKHKPKLEEIIRQEE